MSCSISALNQMTLAEFVGVLGLVFEKTPIIAEQAWHLKPFANVLDLHQKMTRVVAQMSPAEQIELIRAHPELGSKAKMADASVQEQAKAGLTQLDGDDYESFKALNRAYQEKFDFPFIMAVKGHTASSIREAFAIRLNHNRADEIARSLFEISQIARFRLDNIIDS